jgi:hypothetical protein
MINDISLADDIKNHELSELENYEKNYTKIESMFYIDKLKHILIIEIDSKNLKYTMQFQNILIKILIVF